MVVDVVCGMMWLFVCVDCLVVVEVLLGNNCCVDLMGLCLKGLVIIVEVKVLCVDLFGDVKWIDYFDYCDWFFWVILVGFDVVLFDWFELFFECVGLIVVDWYDVVIVCEFVLIFLVFVCCWVEILCFVWCVVCCLIGDIDD